MIDIKTGIDKNANQLIKCSGYNRQANEAFKNNDYDILSASIEKQCYMLERTLIDTREVLYTVNANFPKTISEYFNESATKLYINVSKVNVPFVLYKISMPFLLPNRRSNFTLFKDTIATTLYYAVDNFCKTNNIEQIRYAAVAIVTSINNDNNLYLSDNDNKEYATVLNILSNHFIVDDNGLLCEQYSSSKITTGRSTTNIYITEHKNFTDMYKIIQDI